MSKKCGRCEKTVYPTEELKCLDKVWHKLCFKCKDCGMALNMRNYKGFNKEPYCDAHIPKAKATTMAETPELRRIAENTKLQSNIKYHADFEKSKGKFTQVADDPETLRIKQNTKIISNVVYHGDLIKKAEMEQKRQINENSNGIKDPDIKNANHLPIQPQTLTQPPSSYNPPSSSQLPQPAQMPIVNPNHIGKISEYDPQATTGNYQSPYSSRNSQTLIYSSDVGSVNNPPQRHIDELSSTAREIIRGSILLSII